MFSEEAAETQDTDFSSKAAEAEGPAEFAEFPEAAESVQCAEAAYMEGNITVFIENLLWLNSGKRYY